MTGGRPRRFAFGSILALLCWAFVELASILLIRWQDGRWFSPAAFAVERGSIAGVGAPGSEMAVPQEINLEVLHPFVGFVLNSDLNVQEKRSDWGRLKVTDLGFLRPPEEPATPRDEGEFRIGIFGGSVAAVFSFNGREALLRGLETSSALAGRKVRVDSFALGGYKQPQQLSALVWMLVVGNRFDVVVNIDGFNELALTVNENLYDKVYPFYPRAWPARVKPATDRRQLEKIGALAFHERRRRDLALQANGLPLGWSPTFNLVWRIRDRVLTATIETARREANEGTVAAAAGYQALGPPFTVTDATAVLDEIAKGWKRSSLLMRELASASGARYYHLLQPNQYVPGSKPFTPEERATAYNDVSGYRPLVEEGYPILQREGEELARAGVRFVDLSMLFRDVSEPLYVDACCHFGQRGNEILGETLAAEIRRDLERQP